MSQKLSFQEILDSAVLPPPDEKIETTDRKTITADEQRRETAKIARLISRGHAGYTLWDRAVTEEFEKAITDLYNNISGDLDLKNSQKTGFYNRIDDALRILPDEHLKVSPGKGNLIPREPNAVSVGENSCPEEKPWEIKQSENGKSVILAIRDLGSTQPQDWLKLQKETREALFNEDGTEKCDSLIIDVRGNPGGPSIPYELIGKMLYGNETAPFEKSVYRDTPENDYLRRINGEISKEEYTQRSKNHKYTGEFVTACDYTGHKQEFPPFVNGGFKNPITLLTDRQTASAGESLCQLLKGHPGLTVAGENTAGCYAENSGDCARNHFDYGVKIATSHVFVREGHSCEQKGFSVDLETTGRDALAFVIENHDQIYTAARKRLDAYALPQTAKNRDDRLAFNDMMFIRELNKGNLKKETIQDLYDVLYPEKQKKFDNVILPETSYGRKSDKSLQTTLKEIQKSSQKGSQRPKNSMQAHLTEIAKKQTVKYHKQKHNSR
ncbi:MAG: hypothetical protein J5716_05745 [Alphaproteobacteria bacterium]|nr:hypothetical protein [Alphaproteobacteria bacterium]